MTTEKNKDVILKLVKEYWNEGRVDVLDEVFVPDFLDHHAAPGLKPGREGLKQFVSMFRTSFSDISTTVNDLIAEGDKVAWNWTMRGTHSGEFMGVPATGKKITFSGITIDKFIDGQIGERWSQADFAGLMQQLGGMNNPVL